MKLRPAHVLSAITLSFAMIVPANQFLSMNWHENPHSYVLASVLLANPFILLLAGHLFMVKTLKQHAFLTLGNLVLWLPWSFASFLIAWFQAGWYGVIVCSLILMCMACTYLVAAVFAFGESGQHQG